MSEEVVPHAGVRRRVQCGQKLGQRWVVGSHCAFAGGTAEVEYHKPYLRFNKPVKVPRGQASFTLDETIHYSYKAAGGSPPNRTMDETLLSPVKPSTSHWLPPDRRTHWLTHTPHADQCIAPCPGPLHYRGPHPC